VVDGAGHPLTSTITLSSIDRLALKIGDAVVVIARATNVMIGQAGK
jgi:molybdopterin-binding protein